ncbi:MAG: hypothetical protein ACU0BF_09795 [Paracoccaceae bacterium]
MPDTPPSSPARRLATIAVPVVAVALLLALVFLRPGASAEPLPAPGLDAPVVAEELRGKGYPVTLAVLAAIYEAFASTDEARIYDGLATVAAGEALEALYLERAGALASGGIPDQTVMELTLRSGDWQVRDGRLEGDVRWAVLGQVGHAEHTHLRGNAYAATLVMAPTDGAWRLTGFDLTDVDRTQAGEMTSETIVGAVTVGGPMPANAAGTAPATATR